MCSWELYRELDGQFWLTTKTTTEACENLAQLDVLGFLVRTTPICGTPFDNIATIN